MNYKTQTAFFVQANQSRAERAAAQSKRTPQGGGRSHAHPAQVPKRRVGLSRWRRAPAACEDAEHYLDELRQERHGRDQTRKGAWRGRSEAASRPNLPLAEAGRGQSHAASVQAYGEEWRK